MSRRAKETPGQAYERTRKWLDASEDPAQTPVCDCAKQERCEACEPPPATTQKPQDEEERCDGSGVLAKCDCRPDLDSGGFRHENDCSGRACPGCPNCQPDQCGGSGEGRDA